ADPHLIELGYLESQGAFRDLERFPEGHIYEGVLILRIDAPLYFANMEALQERIELSVSERPSLTHIILDFSGVPDLDAVAIDTFEMIIQNYNAAGIEVHFCGIRGHVRDIIRKAGWEKRFKMETRHPSVQIVLESLGLMNRFTTIGAHQRIGLFGIRPLEDILPATTEYDDE
ncbi:MAG: sodium-independent anion transporter, partial [Chloroflexota bacterium]